VVVFFPAATAEPNSNPEESIYFDAVAVAKTESNAKATASNNYIVNTSTTTINNMNNIYNNLNLNSINNNINSNSNHNFNINVSNNNNVSSRNVNAIQQNNSRNNNGATMNVVEMDVMIKPNNKKQQPDTAGNPMGYNVRLYEDNLKIQRYKIVNSVNELTSDNAASTSNTGGQCECTATANAIVLAPTTIAASTLVSPGLVGNFGVIDVVADAESSKPLDPQANDDGPEPYDVALKLHGAKFNPNNVESKPNNSLDSSKMMDENTSSSMFSDGMKVQQIRYNIGGGGDGGRKETTHFNMAGMAMAGSKIPIFHPTNSRIAKCASWAGVDSTNSSMSSTNPDMADLTPGELTRYKYFVAFYFH
jgi:hypothetical protein